MAANKRKSAKERAAARKAAKVTKGAQNAAEAVGWWFWIGAFVVCMPIGIWLAWTFRDPYQDGAYYPIMLGIFGAAVVSGIVSVSVNYVLEKRARRKKLIARKANKKKH